MSEIVISAFFRILNFVVLIFGAWFVFRRYFEKNIGEDMQKEEAQIQELQEQAITLQRNQRLVEERIAYDKKYAQTLTKKIEQWHDYVKNSHEQEKTQDALMHRAAQQRREIQKKRIQQQWFNKQVFPRALERAQEDLIKEYASKEQQEKFIRTIIQTMKSG